MTHHVIISIASNRNQSQKLAEARNELNQILEAPHFTSELWTEPVGRRRTRSLYLNQLVNANYAGTQEGLITRLKQIEVMLGRTDQERLRGIVDIDLDLLLFDDERLHLRDWERPYIQQLIKEL